MGDQNVDLHDSEADEALSFCDWPLNDDSEWEEYYSNEYQKSPSPNEEFFEFFSDLSSDSFPAGEIIFCGKLLYREESFSKNRSHKSANKEEEEEDDKKRSFSIKNLFRRQRSEPSNGLQRSRTCIKDRFFKNSSSLNCQKVSNSKISSTLALVNDRIPTDKSFGKCDNSVRRLSAPSSPLKHHHKWHLFMFGLVRFQPEMELRDIRKRQSGRIPASLFPAFNGEETVSVKRQRGKSSWKLLLQALSCRGNGNAVVTASFGCIPRV